MLRAVWDDVATRRVGLVFPRLWSRGRGRLQVGFEAMNRLYPIECEKGERFASQCVDATGV